MLARASRRASAAGRAKEASKAARFASIVSKPAPFNKVVSGGRQRRAQAPKRPRTLAGPRPAWHQPPLQQLRTL